MPNAFVVPYVAGTQSGGSYRLVDPRDERINRARFLRDKISPLEYATSLYVASGSEPARGWILLDRQSLNAISTRSSSTGLYATNFQLSMDECVTGGNKLTLKNLAVVQAQCVSTGIGADLGAIFLVELTDKRGVIKNRFFKKGLNAQYNALAPAYPGEYYTGSLSGGTTAWTWTTMIQNIWQTMPLLGTYPGMPITPTGTPQGWLFPGVTALDALQAILEHLGCTIAVNLTQDSPYTIVNSGGGDAAFDTLVSLYTKNKRLQDDAEWLDVGSGRVPGTVVVLFHRRNQIYGTEETVRRDSYQWQNTPVYSVSVLAPATFTNAQGSHYLWDDFTVRYDVDGSPVAADVTTAATIAAERVTQFFNMVYSGTLGFMRKRFTGVLPFFTGSNCDGVCWRMDFRHERLSWVTELVRNSSPVWPEICQ